MNEVLYADDLNERRHGELEKETFEMERCVGEQVAKD